MSTLLRRRGMMSGAEQSTDCNTRNMWERGTIQPTGATVNSTIRLRTITYIPSEVKRITVDEGYSYMLCCYDASGTPPKISAGYACYYNPNTHAFVRSGVYTTNEIVFADIAEYISGYENIRLMLRNENTPTASITLAEYSKIHLLKE